MALIETIIPLVTPIAETASRISTWTGLIAFLGLCALSLALYLANRKARLYLKAMDDPEHAEKWIGLLKPDVPFDARMTAEQIFELAKEQYALKKHRLGLRARFLTRTLYVVGFVTVFSIAIYGGAAYVQTVKPDTHVQKVTSDSLTPAERQVTQLQRAVKAVEAEYEKIHVYTEPTRSQAAGTLATKLRQTATSMEAVADAELRDTYRIIKNHYLLSAQYRRAVAHFILGNNAEVISSSKAAIAAGNKVLTELDTLRDTAGLEKKYAWMVADEMKERTQYYLAVALAVNAQAGGTHTHQEARAMLESIPIEYRNQHQPDVTNPHLKWALAQVN